MAGTTMLDNALETISKCKSFPKENFYLSAYEPELIETGRKHAMQIFFRSEQSANSEGTPMVEMYEWWDRIPFKYAVLVNACAPFLTPETIDDFYEAYKHSESEGMFGVIEKQNYFWNFDKKLLTPLTESVMNTKTVCKTYEAAHCLYAGNLDRIGEGVWMGDFSTSGSIELFPMDEDETFDVDYEWQFNMADILLREVKR
jgi:CMP-N-acetylneuraminic acid synthetase